MNSVEITGVTKKRLDDMYRYVEYRLPCYNEFDKDTQVIVAKYWPNLPNCRFSSIEEGKRIAIRGHLDVHENYGTILIVEQFEVL